MDIKSEYRKTHAEFPWLSLDDPDGIEDCLVHQALLDHGEHVVSVRKAGEGNMNLTLLVETDRRRFVLKQARPWVEKYDHIPAPWDRILFEQRYYARVAEIPDVADQSPQIIAVDPGARTIVMEYLQGARDFIGMYEGEPVSAAELTTLARYLSSLHNATRGCFHESLSNRDMRALNFEHIFVIPLSEDAGLELDGFEPGLDAAVARLKRDDDLKRNVADAGKRYLADGPCLLHGDFFPGSWMRTSQGIVIIDPEFCFFGDPEFDVGVTIAHLAMGRRPREDTRRILDDYDGVLDPVLLAHYAGIEIMRRLAGVAQLPIPPSVDFRASLLMRARQAVVDARFEALWD